MHFYTKGTATIDLAMFTTITCCIVKNDDLVNGVSLVFNTTAGAVTVIVPARGILVVTDILAANDLAITALAGSPQCKIIVTGT